MQASFLSPELFNSYTAGLGLTGDPDTVEMYRIRCFTNTASVNKAVKLHRMGFSTQASAPSGGSSLFQRLGSFFAGVGVASTGCGYLIQSELTEANIRFENTLSCLEKRVAELEK